MSPSVTPPYQHSSTHTLTRSLTHLVNSVPEGSGTVVFGVVGVDREDVMSRKLLRFSFLRRKRGLTVRKEAKERIGKERGEGEGRARD